MAVSPPFMCAHVVALECGGDDEWVATFVVLLTSGDPMIRRCIGPM